MDSYNRGYNAVLKDSGDLDDAQLGIADNKLRNYGDTLLFAAAS